MTQTQPNQTQDEDRTLDHALQLLLDQINQLKAQQAHTAKVLNDWIKWNKAQFKAIMDALDKLDAPPSTDKAPALQEIRDQIAELDRDLTTVWRSVFPKDSQAPS